VILSAWPTCSNESAGVPGSGRRRLLS